MQRRWGTATAAVCAAVMLSACSSTAVEESVLTSIAPLTRAAAPSSATSDAPTSTPTQSASPTASSRATREPQTSASPQTPDRAVDSAGEASAPPTQSVQLSFEDQRYLQALGKGGIDTQGIETELIGVGKGLCVDSDSNFGQAAIEAVSGQLIEQNRASGSFEEVSSLIADEARRTYC